MSRTTERFALLCVYRSRNEAIVTDLVRTASASGARTHLWALDEPAPNLSEWTRGSGAGGRFDLINRLLQTIDPDVPVIVSDDDVRMHRGGIIDLLERAEAAKFHIAQPAHARSSHSTYKFSRRRPHLVARRTNFIEIGPMFVVTSRGRKTFTPFPDGTGMGWGVDLLWRDLALSGTPIGIVDDVAIRHLTPLGHSYAMADEGKKLRRMLDERGLTDIESSQATFGRWWHFQDEAPWLRNS